MAGNERFAGKPYDLLDPELFLDGPPHAIFDDLRANQPVHSMIAANGERVWALTRHADIRAVTNDPARFTNTKGPIYMAIVPDPVQTRANIIWNDPPNHTRLRYFYGLGFSPRVVRNFEPWIRNLANEIIDDIGSTEEFDFVNAVSLALPARVICAILGIPAEDRRKATGWVTQLISLTSTTEDGFAQYLDAFDKLTDYASYLWKLKEQSPGDDMVTMLLDASYEGKPITEEEYLRFIVMTVTAGFETTHSALGLSMLSLINDQDAYSDLRVGDNKLVANAVDELLRLATPAMHMMRSPNEDWQLHDVTIPAGEKVTLWFSAANRDPGVFADPHKLDIRRNATLQAAFGTGGPHFCIGNRLARLEMIIMFEEMFRRLPRFELNGDVVRTPSIFVNGLLGLPVRVVH